MRIDRLDLIAFGRFSDTSLDLSGGEQGLHLIYGDNEAGKSTSLRALVAWLFGIPARTRDNFNHSNAQLRIGGRLRLTNGRILEFVRRKGNKGTMLDPASGEALDEGLLASFLPQGIDETLFKNLYGIDHDRLVAGGRELLDQSGDVGQALFSAAAGTAGLKKVVADLRAEAEDLFKPRASTKVINQALIRYKEARKQLREATFPVAEWKRLHAQWDETLGQIREVEEVIRGLSEEKSRLERLLRVKGALAERRTVMQRLQELRDVPLLPEHFEEDCALARKDLSTGEKDRNKALAKLDQLEQEVRSFHVRQDLLDHEAEIVRLFKAMGAVEKIHEDRPGLAAQQRLLRNEARAHLKSVRPDMSLDAADQELRPLVGNKKWVATLASKHEALVQKEESARNLVQEIVDERDALSRELADIPTVHLDVREVKAVIAAASKAGDLEPRLDDTEQRVHEAQQALETLFASLGRFAGTMDELAAVPLPVSETLDMYEKRFEDLHETRKDVQTRLGDAQKELRGVEQELGALLLQDHVPTMEDLNTARAVRDQGWDLVKGLYIERRQDMAQAVSAFASSGDLPQTYETYVLQADTVADALRAGSDLVAKRANLEMRKKELTTRIDDLSGEKNLLQEAETQLAAAWQGLWHPLGIEAGTPREMKQWLLRVEKMIADMKSARVVSLEAQRLKEELKRHKEAVSRQMLLLDPSCSPRDMGLAAMIAWCEQRIQGVETDMARRKQVEASLDKIDRRMSRAREALKAVEAEQARWQEEWTQAVQGLGVTPDVHPQVALNTLDRLESFFKAFDESKTLGRRLFGMDQVEQEFEDSVRALAQRAGWDISGQKATTFVAQLSKDVAQARDARGALKKITNQQQELRQELQDAEISIRAAQKKLAELRERANVSRDEDLEQVGEISRKRNLVARLEHLEQELARNGDGLSIEALEAEYAQARVDALDAELDKICLTLEEYQQKRDELRDARQALHTKMHANDGSSFAAGAMQDAQEQLAVITSGVEEYLRLRIAERMLEQQIEAYRKENQGPLLGRAGELFARLTLGSYAGLRDELDSSGAPVLLGIRPNDDEVPIDGMSEGTRDQLYLALRLATLEKHFGKGEPMPFVVDDILVGFDDSRTQVGLEVLADLAAQTQVLLFTHHSRVLELSRKIDVPAGLFVHRL
ncbi:YhaN family protein [Desulfoplanes formicivorans]|uniref:SMC domain protein n=1 Tax=Desulfoplanes formicivorans TaxID=1592317 RepID=A0A194ADJ7_9BACT|nr:YhaN family protein [Desulfoplanes formicivorans]GAU07418.1 SMC domain protein [Desulfoplanes formicivorans]